MQIKAATRLLATDRRTVARRLFIEMDPYMKDIHFNPVDSSLSFKCELNPVMTVLTRLGFEPTEDQTILERDGTRVRVRQPRDEWNPVLNII